jgi:holo-[acyl-carrier protein] synthase
MICGLGIDIAQVSRVERVYQLYGSRFARRVLASGELEAFAGTRNPVRFLAMRFAAKEATSKALGTGFRQGVSLRQIEVWHEPSGRPHLRLHGAANARASSLGVRDMYISLTDEQEYAAAVVVFESH